MATSSFGKEQPRASKEEDFRVYAIRSLCISFLPLLVIVANCWASGVLWQSGFNPIKVFYFGESLRSLVPPDHVTTRIPFVSDLPSVALAIASCLSIFQYLLVKEQSKRLPRELRESSLVSRDQGARHEVDQIFSNFEKSCRVSPVLRWSSPPILLGVAAGLLYLVRHHATFFSQVSRLSGRSLSVNYLKSTWWTTHGILLSMSWIILGAAGVFFTLLHLRISMELLKTFRTLKERRLLQYVPSWRSPDNGWRPLARLVDLKVLGLVTFILMANAMWIFFHGKSTVWNLCLYATYASVFAFFLFHFYELHKVTRYRRTLLEEERQAVLQQLNSTSHRRNEGTTLSSSSDDLFRIMMVKDLDQDLRRGVYSTAHAPTFLRWMIAVLSVASAFVTVLKI